MGINFFILIIMFVMGILGNILVLFVLYIFWKEVKKIVFYMLFVGLVWMDLIG